jgi:hypothetical protein
LIEKIFKMLEQKTKKSRIVLINLHGDTNMTAAYLHSLLKSHGYPVVTINFRRMVLDWKVPSKVELDTLND